MFSSYISKLIVTECGDLNQMVTRMVINHEVISESPYNAFESPIDAFSSPSDHIKSPSDHIQSPTDFAITK